MMFASNKIADIGLEQQNLFIFIDSPTKFGPIFKRENNTN